MQKGEVERYKARLAVEGYSQEGIDYDEGICPNCSFGNYIFANFFNSSKQMENLSNGCKIFFFECLNWRISLYWAAYRLCCQKEGKQSFVV